MNENLKKRAEEIRDEKKRSRNSADRVGSFLMDLLNFVSNPNGIPYAISARTDWRGNVIDETYVTKTEFEYNGGKGDKGDSLEFTVLGSYDSLSELEEAYPNGPETNGLFKVGDNLYTWTGSRYELLNLDVIRTFSVEQFAEVPVSNGSILIDATKTPYAKVTLSGDAKVLNLLINNTKDGSTGKILVFQTGFKQISVGSNIKGTIDLPLNTNTIALLTYNRLGNTTYIHSNTVLGDIQFPTPQRIADLQLVYSDSSTCTVQWSAPWANNIYDKATEYDMRYSNSLVDANDAKVWAGLKKVAAIPEPESPGMPQKMTIAGLAANKEYYVYLKSVKVNYGAEYISAASDFVYFKTLGNEDTSKAFRINLSERNLIPQLRNYLTDTNGTVCGIGNMVDEAEKNVYLADGYPDLTNKDYTTFWAAYQYGRDTSPFEITIDLFAGFTIDKLFVYSRSKPYFSVYGMKDLGYDWEKIGEIRIEFNEWRSLDFKSYECRFIKLKFDLMDFGEPDNIPEGEERFPVNEYNGSLDRIDNVLLYGRPVSSRPEGIQAPMRRATVRKTVDQFFCTNGHAYQQGRIHSMCSGEKMRMYLDFGHFEVRPGEADAYKRLADMRFNVSQIAWVSGNNGTGDDLEDTLRNTYLRYGLKPFLCNTGVFSYCYYDKNFSVHNRPCDGYWLPGAWRPVPKRGVGGLDKYHGVTMDALSYRTYAKLCHALAAKYGRNKPDGNNLFYPLNESTETGLNLISGIEAENEPDQNWSGWIGYTNPSEYAAILSASADGHAGEAKDEDGNLLPGTKSGGILSVSSGTASVNRGYLFPAMLWWKANRKNATIPMDAFSMHMYFSNAGSQEGSREPIQYGITLEESLKNATGGELYKIAELRNRLAPTSEIWLTEFGWGESGSRNSLSTYQCYTQPGRRIGDWVLPDRHRSDVKGAWIVRACIQMMNLGVDMVNYYSTECESNYFGAGNWDAGAGFEMFHWNDETSNTPGAKAEAIKKFEHTYARGGFSTTGLFGQILSNGAYPITRAYWWVATLRNRLKGYVFAGMKRIESDSRIVVACFKKEGEEKGAYVVYLNDSRNTGVPGIEIPVPAGVSHVQHVSVYVPEIPNPQNVPGSLGWDRKRTGLPTSRHERYEGGRWKLVNKPYYEDKYASYAQGVAVYPANPKEGDEVVILPTIEENPYFPIVGPVQAKATIHKNNITAGEYEQDREEWETEPELDADGNVIWTVKADVSLSWRQVDAICDYIDHSPEGQHGKTGDEVEEEAIRGMILANVSEFPEYYFFDAVPEPDYTSEVTDLSSRTISNSAVELWWNNTSTEDTAYQIFTSDLPETGYTLLKEVSADIENKALISGLEPDTTYYYKIRPVKGSQTGTMSAYTSVKTYSTIPAPDNLRIAGRTATSITIAWNYTAEQVSDFVHYAIYRADESGSFTQVSVVTDRTIHQYADSNLAVGRVYKYKVRTVGLNGQSTYTDELTTRTLLAEECSPTLLSAITDKLGTKVVLAFDLELGTIAAEAKVKFSLTENGNSRLIKDIYKDDANPTNLILTIPQGSLADYDAKKDIRMSFTGGGILSKYGVAMEAFDHVRVANVIGNFSNIEATYKVNLHSADSGLAPHEEWNNMVGDPVSTIVSTKLTDTYGRKTEIVISSVTENPKYIWGGTNSTGVCDITDIPEDVYKTMWTTAHPSLANEETVSRLRLSGLNSEHRYSIRAFSASLYGSKRIGRLKINGVYSNTVQALGNKTTYMTVEDCKPDSGILNIDLVNMSEIQANADYASISYLIIEEYKSNTEPENTDVWLREATIMEDDGNGIVKSPDVTIHLNLIGTAISYRVSEDENMTDVPWLNIIGNSMDVPYTLSQGFGGKKVYVQVKNLYAESNIRMIDIEYQDTHVALQLKNVYINNNDSKTYSSNVTVMADKEGTPSYYKISETADLTTVPWLRWPDPKTSVVPYTLLAGAGQKTVYLQLKDSLTESATKADTIAYEILQYVTATVTVDIPAGIDPATVNVRMAPLKYNKRFAYGYTTDDGSMQSYSVIWNLINKKWIDDTMFHHIGVDRSANGLTPTKTLGYTDGLGTERRFAVGNALIPIRKHITVGQKYPLEDSTGIQQPNLIFEELKRMYDFDCDWSHHNVDEDEWGSTDPVRIKQGFEEVDAYFKEHMGKSSIIMHEPDGNAAYTTAATSYNGISVLLRQSSESTGYIFQDVLKEGFAAEKVRVARSFPEETWAEYKKDIDAIAAGSILGRSALWGEIGGHTPRSEVTDGNHGLTADEGWKCRYQLLNYINDTFGKDGTDDVWMTTANEVYEYLHFKKHATIGKTVSGQKLTITVSFPKFDNFRWFETTLLLSAGSTVTGDNNVIGLTYGTNNGQLMINVNAMQSLVERAERYTAGFEESEVPEDKEDAMYFIQRLKPELRQPYLTRIAAITQPPVLSQFEITTPGEEVGTPKITVGYTATKATHYMIADSSDFAGAQWKLIGENTIEFTLSSVAGVHTVSFKVKNAYGESAVMTDTITYRPIPFALKSFSVNNGAATTMRREVSVDFVVDGIEVPTHYMLSESPTFVGAQWETYSTPTNFRLSEQVGVKTIYAKIKTASEESTVLSRTIELRENTTKLIISLNQKYVVDLVGWGVDVLYEEYNGETINIMRDAKDNIQLKDTAGNNFGVYKMTGTKGNSVDQPVEGEGIYPFKYIAYAFGYTDWNQPATIIPGEFYYELPAGTYKVRILGSTPHSGGGNLPTLFYDVNGMVIHPTSSLIGNYSNFTEIDNVLVGADGALVIKFWSDPTRGNAVALNLIEIIKK